MTDINLEVTKDEINSGVKKANALNGTASEINTILESVSDKQDTLVSGTNIKTINNASILGSGNLTVTADVSNKQDKLISGTNIKTINNRSILGSGNITIEGGGGGGGSSYYPPLLQPIWSDHLLNDESWLRADTFSWQDGTAYSTVYDKLVEEYNASTSVEETEGSKWVQPAISSLTQWGTISGTVSNVLNAFDKNDSTYASISSQTQYIRWDFPIKLKVSQIKATGNFVSATSGQTNFKAYTEVDGERILLGSSTGAAETAPYYSILPLDNVEVDNIIITDFNYPSSYISKYPPRYCQIDITASKSEVTFKRSSNGFKIADASQESAILNKYNNEGIAWYYILDTENKRFKLPRTKFGFEGLRDNVGNDIEESLPNITGSWSGNRVGTTLDTGGFNGSLYYIGGAGSSRYGADYVTGAQGIKFGFDASRSSSAYQDNAPVQERATQMYLYFYVGEYSQSAIEQTAGLNAELLNAKVDQSSLRDATVVIETYVNGTSGYRIWDDGYCEQWGQVYSNNNTTTTISFVKTFTDTNYQVLTTSFQTYHWIAIGSKSVGSCQLNYHDDGSATAGSYTWKASGYLAEGEY